MNEFTKEELVLLACWSVNRYEQVGNDQAQDEGTISLSHKIQDMIVNYCDHESNGYWSQLADCSYRSLRCSKCRKEFGRQKFNNELNKFEDE